MSGIRRAGNHPGDADSIGDIDDAAHSPALSVAFFVTQSQNNNTFIAHYLCP